VRKRKKREKETPGPGAPKLSEKKRGSRVFAKERAGRKIGPTLVKTEPTIRVYRGVLS